MPSELPILYDQIVACRRCPRLVAWMETVARTRKREFADWTYWARPLPGFGDPRARVLVVGLAPAAHGGTRTGRMFTGDSSGAFLMRAMHRAGFANQPSSVSRDDGLRLRDAYIVVAARCAPPGNKPLPDELEKCRSWLRAEVALLPRLRLFVALGRVAWNACLKLALDLGLVRERVRAEFAHLARVQLGRVMLIGSYHPSRQNTNTGLLTERMFDRVFAAAQKALAE